MEVDFLLRRGRAHLAIGAKLGRASAPRDLAGLRAIADLPRLVRRIVVCGAERPRRTEDGIEILPVASFLDLLTTGGLWP